MFRTFGRFRYKIILVKNFWLPRKKSSCPDQFSNPGRPNSERERERERERVGRIKRPKAAFAAALALGAVCSATVIASSCAPNALSAVPKIDYAKFDNPLQPISLSAKQREYEETNARENLLEDAKQKAADDQAVLVYSVNWLGVLHKFGTVSHLLKVLELNPKKEIQI